MRVLPVLPAAIVLSVSLAQERLPVPDAAQQAAVQKDVLQCVADVVGADGSSRPGAADRLLATAERAASPVLRFGLLHQAMRCAIASNELAAGLRAATELGATFAVDAPCVAFLTGAEREGCAAPQTLAHACLECAVRTMGNDDGQFAASLALAERVAAVDDPPGLAMAVGARCATLRTLVARATNAGPPVTALLALHPRLLIGGIANVEPTFTEADDLLALARIGERRLVGVAQEPDPLLRAVARRRALALLKPYARTTPSDSDEHAEVVRVRRLVERTSALAVERGIGAMRFELPDDLARLRIDGGTWHCGIGELRGASLGAAVETRATVRFAWHRIDSVTVRGGVAPGEATDFWIAAGTVKVLLRHDDSNVVFLDEERVPVVPGMLQPRQEHCIVLRQCGDTVTVGVDGAILRSGAGDLSGTVSVWPANGSEIFVRAIDIVGEVDLGRVVVGPDGAAVAVVGRR